MLRSSWCLDREAIGAARICFCAYAAKIDTSDIQDLSDPATALGGKRRSLTPLSIFIRTVYRLQHPFVLLNIHHICPHQKADRHQQL